MEIKNTPNHHFYSSSTSKPYSRTENCYKNMWLNTYRRELGEDRTSFQLYRFQHTPVKFEENLPANMNHADPRIAYLNISAITSTGWKADESDVPLDLSLQPKDMSLRSQPALQPHCQNFCSNIRRKSLTREERITKFSLLHNDNQENESEKFSKKMVSPQSRIMFTQNKVSAQEIDPRDTRFDCKHCKSINSQFDHGKQVPQHKTKVYYCDMCEKSYKQARDYRAHVAAHKNGSLFKCDMCMCVLSNSSDYLHHLKTHKQKDLHFCHHCKKYFRDGCTLATHMRTHTGEKPYKCEECRKEFRQIGTYRRHKKLHRKRSSNL
ncbi:zinc finger protein 271-like isoform X1 [Watersipora subatra]|uniref:zinc finger protein 271-like isoform X1 n=1 Tax=Watersipora subatra TaxID=2589382 RepID=UPI00355C612A